MSITTTALLKTSFPLPLPERPSVQTFSHTETVHGAVLSLDWRVERRGSQIWVEKSCAEHTATARYNLDWEIQDFKFLSADRSQELHIELLDGSRIHITARKGTRVHVREGQLKGGYPWVQQTTFGFKKFALDAQQNTFDFYGIRPDNCDLLHIRAKKIGLEEVPGFGRLLKIEIRPASFWLHYLRKGELWIDPETGELRKLIDSGAFNPTMITEFVNN